jgi:two-component system sensor histidine kinase UhpB
MRERALLIGAELTVGPNPDDGTEVQLSVPTRTRSS